MRKTRKAKSLRQKRPIEDVPFYKVQHSSDDLPLDPFRPFITEEISMTHNTVKEKNICEKE